MLILTRKNDESIIIGDGIEVKILEVYDGRVKIGIDAPKDVTVLRKEILDAIEENKEALKRAPGKDELSKIINKK